MKRCSRTSVRNGKDSARAGQSSSTESARSATRCGLRSDRPFVPRPTRPDRTGFGALPPFDLVRPQKDQSVNRPIGSTGRNDTTLKP